MNTVDVQKLVELSKDRSFIKQLDMLLKAEPDALIISESLSKLIRDCEAQAAGNEDAFIEFLKANADRRGVMAALRAGLSDILQYRGAPIVHRFNPERSSGKQKALRYVGAWFALHPAPTDRGNIGSVCRRLLSDDERRDLESQGEPGPLTKRFLYLLAAEHDEVYDRITPFIRRAKGADGIRVNYQSLFVDLQRWHSGRKKQVKESWARGFWDLSEPLPNPASQTTEVEVSV